MNRTRVHNVQSGTREVETSWLVPAKVHLHNLGEVRRVESLGLKTRTVFVLPIADYDGDTTLPSMCCQLVSHGVVSHGVEVLTGGTNVLSGVGM